jgi:hypothetical protein
MNKRLIVAVGLALLGFAALLYANFARADGLWLGTSYREHQTGWMYQHDIKNKVGVNTKWRFVAMGFSDDSGDDLTSETITSVRTDTVCLPAHGTKPRPPVCRDVETPVTTTVVDNESNRNAGLGVVRCWTKYLGKWGGAGCVGPIVTPNDTPQLPDQLNVFAGLELRRKCLSIWPIVHVSSVFADDHGVTMAMLGWKCKVL